MDWGGGYHKGPSGQLEKIVCGSYIRYEYLVNVKFTELDNYTVAKISLFLEKDTEVFWVKGHDA